MRIKKTKNAGLGVFATRDYQKGDTVEECRIIEISPKDRKIIDKTDLYNYYFSWGKNLDKAAIALGNVSLYNHSYKPNAKYIKDFDNNKLLFLAHTDIQNGDEIRVNYNEDPSSLIPLWFSVVD
jgi:SET domain-containing protein